MASVLDRAFGPERFFEDISRIPHGSFHEKPLSDYLVQFARERGLRVKQYDIGNVIVYKDASAGYETHEPVLLQAHMDMVCEKTSQSDHDFSKDPLALYVEDGRLHARDTTLGADDGVGVAYMMAILDDDSLPHPPLECLFTVQEEVGCLGAMALDGADVTARRMIGLDNVTGDSTYICSAGAQILHAARKVSRAPASSPCYELKVSGLLGGHSGEDIHLERGNAIRLAARTLFLLAEQGCKVSLSAFSCPGKINSIPRECIARFACDCPAPELEQKVAAIARLFAAELRGSDDGLTLTLTPTEAALVCGEKESGEILDFIMLFPTGLRHRSMTVPDLTTASNNLGVIGLEDDVLSLSSMARGAEDSFFDEVTQEVSVLCRLFGFTLELAGRTPCWPLAPHSDILRVAQDAFRAVLDRELTLLAVHGGLECGAFSAAVPGLDIVTIGPYVEGCHTYGEWLDLKSFASIYEVLLWMLRNL